MLNEECGMKKDRGSGAFPDSAFSIQHSSFSILPRLLSPEYGGEGNQQRQEPTVQTHRTTSNRRPARNPAGRLVRLGAAWVMGLAPCVAALAEPTSIFDAPDNNGKPSSPGPPPPPVKPKPPETPKAPV